MGKREGTKKAQSAAPGFRNPISLREEVTGRKQFKGGSNNSKSMLKLEHLQKLAAWASGDAAIPSLAAFFGHRVATVSEALGVPPDPPLVSCERCETMLQPGANCTVRIEKNRAKARCKSKKPNNVTQNNVVYRCNFCSHWNRKRGTPKGHMKEICRQVVQPSSKSQPANRLLKCASSEKGTRSKDDISKTDEIASPAFTREIPATDSPATPTAGTGTTLLEANKRKRNRSTSNKPAGPERNSTPTNEEKTISTSNKRRRKSWTSLKEIAESTEQSNTRDITNLRIPFCM
ncbi:hypothetical protein CJ030_MR8G015352 [Morella rubra]|uniref:Uncharacterized protein n=1 Tax=Morella rubra TaxID=262757 RepID=A0A6A1UT05_9ROSI|nr:hypothetical protein CJ030_MR8G015352 [Morella rubra]